MFSALFLTCAAEGKAQDVATRKGGELTNHDVRTVFFVAKSENKNQVHYGVRATPACKPRGVGPVFGYWRDLEEGPNVVSPLLAHEQRAYGLEREQKIVVARQHTVVEVRLRSVPTRAIRIRLSKDRRGRCAAVAMTRIGGQEARLDHIFVQVRSFLGLPVGAEYLAIRGKTLSSNKQVEEKLSP